MNYHMNFKFRQRKHRTQANNNGIAKTQPGKEPKGKGTSDGGKEISVVALLDTEP